MSGRDDFELWYGQPLAQLMASEHAGFPVVMIAFPLLERYLRQKSQAEPNTPPFNRALLAAVPELTTEAHANLFWAIYRHGLLHNVALSRESHGLSHAKPIVEVWPNDKVWLNPNLFAERVLAAIRSDFAVFEQGIPLPKAATFSEFSASFQPGGTFAGTSFQPPPKK